MKFQGQNWLCPVLKKKLIIKQREKVSDIEGQNTGGEIFNPIHTNEISKQNTYICGRVLF